MTRQTLIQKRIWPTFYQSYRKAAYRFQQIPGAKDMVNQVSELAPIRKQIQLNSRMQTKYLK